MPKPRLPSRVAWFAAGALLVASGLAALASRSVTAEEPVPARAHPLTAADWPMSSAEERGRLVYEKYCIGCHGAEGRGDGPAAAFLDPLPRNFQSAKFKFRTTASGEFPLDADLLRTVTCGLPGSSMPGFPLVAEIQRRDVVSYVLHLAKFGLANQRAAAAMADDGLSLDELRRERLPQIRAAIDEMAAGARRVSVPPETASGTESVQRGRAIFDKQCAACHGARGVGDGASSYTLRDWQNAAIRPRDFTTGVFRSGSTPEDVFIRVKTGLTGTPMPGYSNLADAELWDIVHFIQSLKDPAAEKPHMQPGCGHEGDRR